MFSFVVFVFVFQY